MLKICSVSHLDHGLTPEHVTWLLERFKDRSGFFIQTVELPAELGDLDCALYGPAVDDEPIAESDVRYVVRGKRPCASRIVNRPTRKTRKVTVIAGPSDEGECTLYTAYGGPMAPREPGDPTIPDFEAIKFSRDFWAAHALAGE